MSKSHPKISVIMPSLNVENYIGECIESVINQSLSDLEIICVDAGSTDKTLDILNEYADKDSRIKIVHSSEKSYGYQMNLGLDLATGEYIGIVETDDYIDLEMYENLYSFSDEGEMDIVKCTFYHVYDYDLENPLVIDWAKNELKNVKNVFKLNDQERFIDGHPSIWAGIYRRKFLQDNKIKFVEEPGGGWVDNGFFFETACAAKKIIYRPKPYYYYREDNPNSSSNSLKDFTIPIRRMIENLEIINKYTFDNIKVLRIAYVRVFAYINNIRRRDGYEEHLDELNYYIRKMMLMLDENIVLNMLDLDQQKMYYKYISDFRLDEDLESEDEMLRISDFYVEKIHEINKELQLQKNKNKELASMNKSLTLENTNLKRYKDNYSKKCSELTNVNLKNEELTFEKYKLNNYLSDIENSTAFKVGTAIASPIRNLKGLKHNKNKKLNVLFIPSDNNRTSGAFLSMVNLISNLKTKYGINELVILPNKGNGDEILSSFGINFILIDSKDWVVPLNQERNESFFKEIDYKKRINRGAILKIREVIQNNNFDIMHINTTYSYVGAKAALKENLPFVWHLREFLEEDQNNTLWNREEGNKLINNANKIIAISDSIFKKYEDTFDNGKLIRIYNGIDATKFYKSNKTILNDNIIKFIMVGGFEYYKGQIEFAKACAKLYNSGFHNFEVSFVGTGRGDVKEKVEKILSDANVTNVKYLGYKQNVQDFYEKSDVSFTCSKSEAFGRTTVEAMLSGNLVIGADSAGTRELIIDGKTGVLYEQGNSQDLFKKMKWVIENINESKQMAANGRDFMSKNMTAEINADNIFSVYNEIIHK